MQVLKLILFFGMLNGLTFGLVALENKGQEAIQSAEKENKYLFIFFYKEQNEKMLRMQKIFDQAIQKLGDRIKSIKIKSNDPNEKSIIDRFNLKRTPMPFVLVLAPNGAITGGFPSFTEEQLLDSITSTSAAKCLKELQEHKLVILCLQNSQTTNNEAALIGINDFKADPRYATATEIVMIDPSNIQEHKFLNQLALDNHPSQATTVLIAPPAEVIGKYQGPITKAQLVTDLQNAASGCCGPGGCCPGGKCGTKK